MSAWLTVFCPDSALTEHRDQWRKWHLPLAASGVSIPPFSAPFLCSGNERHVLPLEMFFLAASPPPDRSGSLRKRCPLPAGPGLGLTFLRRQTVKFRKVHWERNQCPQHGPHASASCHQLWFLGPWLRADLSKGNPSLRIKWDALGKHGSVKPVRTKGCRAKSLHSYGPRPHLRDHREVTHLMVFHLPHADLVPAPCSFLAVKRTPSPYMEGHFSYLQ